MDASCRCHYRRIIHRTTVCWCRLSVAAVAPGLVNLAERTSTAKTDAVHLQWLEEPLLDSSSDDVLVTFSMMAPITM